MAIPYESKPLPAVSTFPFDISAWRGVNIIKGAQADGEMADCKNMCSDNYPYASPRKPREKIIDEAGIKRIYKVEENRVYYIDSEDYLCFAENGEKFFVTDSGGNKILMPDVKCTNNYDKCSVFYPNMKYINEKGELKNPEHNFWFGSVYTESKYMGVTTIVYSGGATAVENTDNRTVKICAKLPLKYEDGEPIADEDYEYPWPINDVHVMLSCVIFDKEGVEKCRVKATTSSSGHAYITGRENIYEFELHEDEEFEEGDWMQIELSVSAALGTSAGYTINDMISQADYIRNSEWKYICDDVKDSIYMYGFDYGVVYNNRIVCVKGNEIRGSALGDFSNFTEYVDEAGNPSATGAYPADVGSAGDFTGICAYNNVLLLFKKDIVYEMYGSMPYTITGLCNTGCIDNDSIASIDGVLYWASPKGIVRYSGGVPNVISSQVDIKTDGIAKAGTDGRKYYVFDGRRTYVYDTYYQMWHIEDDENVRMRFNHINELYGVYDDGIYKIDSGDEAVEWEFETKDFTFASKERKNLSKLWIRAEMPKRSRLEVYARQNGGEWSRVAVKTAEKDEMFDFKLRIKKCDSYALKFKGRGDVRILDIHGKVTVGTSKHRAGNSLNVYRR